VAKCYFVSVSPLPYRI